MSRRAWVRSLVETIDYFLASENLKRVSCAIAGRDLTAEEKAILPQAIEPMCP